MTKKIHIPKQETIPEAKKTLPYIKGSIPEKSFSFSFACFNRSHELFNLGDNTATGTVSANWFIDFLDALKSVSEKTFAELKGSTHDLHPIEWKKTNASAPDCNEQYDYWQFRINKAKGRVIGFLIDNVFYVVWLDPHHNLTNSEGYGGPKYFKAGKSLFEIKERELQMKNEEINQLKTEINRLKDDLQAAEELLEECKN